jgi:hypothetical protein
MVEGEPIKHVNANKSGRTQQEIDDDIDFFTNHPFNARKITPELLETPEFQAL